MTVKAEITTLLGEIHNSIGETDSLPLDWSRPSRRRIAQIYPEIIDTVGIGPITNIFSVFKNERSVGCDMLALTLQDLLNKLGGRFNKNSTKSTLDNAQYPASKIPRRKIQ